MATNINFQNELIDSNQFITVNKDTNIGRCLGYLPSKPNWFSRLIGWFKEAHPTSNLNRVVSAASKIAQETLNLDNPYLGHIIILKKNLALLNEKAIKHNSNWFVKLISFFTKRILCSSETIEKVKDQIIQLESLKEGCEKITEPSQKSEETPASGENSQEIPPVGSETFAGIPISPAKYFFPNNTTPPVSVPVENDSLKEEIDLKIEQAAALPDQIEKAKALTLILNRLVNMGNLSKALKAATLIPNNIELQTADNKLNAIKLIAKHYIIKKEFDQALACADLIDNANAKKPLIFLDIVRNLIETKEIEKALEVSTMLTDHSYYKCKSQGLKCISKYFLTVGNFDQALQIAHQIPEWAWKDGALEKIAKVFVSINKFEKAITLLESIQSNQIKFEIVELICKKIRVKIEFTSDQYQLYYKLLDVLDKIDDAAYKLQCFDLVPLRVLSNFYVYPKKDFDKAIETAKKIEYDKDKYYACTEIMKALTGKNEPSKAYNAALEILGKNENEIDQAIKSGIVNIFVNSCDYESSLQYIDKIKSPNTKSRAFSRLIKHAMIPEGKFVYATHIAQSIPNEEIKLKVLKLIVKKSKEVSSGELQK